ncbi:MAG: ferredoxin [Candidatus Altiarchaeales archaeon]|nr:MAG: ferredoxin [Candidatus Altiarchaeales archaeon]
MVDIKIDKDACLGCGVCVNTCPVGMYELNDDKATIVGNLDDCTLCRACESSCPAGAITISE